VWDGTTVFDAAVSDVEPVVTEANVTAEGVVLAEERIDGTTVVDVLKTAVPFPDKPMFLGIRG
jgi:hypothetical protein